MGDLRTTAALCCIVSIATFASTMMLRRLCAVGGATARRGVASASAAACCQGCCSAPISSVRTETTVVGNAVEQALRPEVRHLHAQAVAEGKDTYIDPDTGLTVLTRLSHLRRGDCCGSRCRHCPYNHKNVPGAAVPKTEPAPPKPVAAAGESVKHSVVYTKGGDKGSSSLFTGERRKKTDVVFEALGAIDELSSHVGLARALLREGGAKGAEAVALLALLEDIQQQLLNAGTVVATPAAGVEATPGSMASLLDTYKFPDKTLELEKVIDVTDSRLVPLRIFILPGGGNASSAQLHVCRTTCRRAERRMIDVRDAYGPQYTDHLRQASVYVNRLSDFFFVAARSVAEEDIVRKYD